MEEGIRDYVIQTADSNDEPLVSLIDLKTLITSKYAEDSYGSRKIVLDRYIPNILTVIDDGFCRILQSLHRPKSKILFLFRILSIVLPRIRTSSRRVLHRVLHLRHTDTPCAWPR